MVSCEYCGDSIDTLAYECNYCSQSFCRSHRVPESHDCRNVSAASPPTSAADRDDATFEQSRDKSLDEIDFRDTNIDLQDLRERAKAEAEGEPYSVAEVQQTVGTTPDSDFDSSPDVAVDGSVKQRSTQQDASTEDSHDSSADSKRGVAVILLLLFAVVLSYVVFIL